MLELKVIIGSTRPARIAPTIASWIVGKAEATAVFNVEVLDLAEINLPFVDEPNLPRSGNYTKEHTKAWSRTISTADLFVMLTPEYNGGFSAPLKNALDYLCHEWSYKPVGLVTYGGVSAGTRAGQMLKQVVTSLHMMPLPEAVHVPFVAQFINADGVFQPTPVLESAADLMFKELLRWANALKMLRATEHRSALQPQATIPSNRPL